ncbi:hypothetical protein E4T56_gene16716 [Termitomyces sp. T112]|nr:hypothetical protein E4T56_gene16716 [Termitomyces sp. T112]
MLLPNASLHTIFATSYAPCLRHGPVALASFQTQPHFVWSLYFKLNAKSQTQPHFVWLGPCISNLMLIPRPNLTLFDPPSLCLVRSLYFKLNANSQTQPHFVWSLYFKLNAKSQTQPHFVWSLYFKLNVNFQTQPHFVWLGLFRSLYFKLVNFQTQPHFVWSLYFKLNAKSQTQPHFVWLGPCISNLMLSPRPNLTLFG